MANFISGARGTGLRVQPTLFVPALIAGCLAAPALAGTGTADSRNAFFETNIRPVLVARCLKCHGGEKTSNSLSVSTRDALLKGGDSGPAILPGRPEQSLLLQAIRYQSDDLKMPPDKKLPDRVIADFEQCGLVRCRVVEHRCCRHGVGLSFGV